MDKLTASIAITSRLSRDFGNPSLKPLGELSDCEIEDIRRIVDLTIPPTPTKYAIAVLSGGVHHSYEFHDDQVGLYDTPSEASESINSDYDAPDFMEINDGEHNLIVITEDEIDHDLVNQIQGR